MLTHIIKNQNGTYPTLPSNLKKTYQAEQMAQDVNCVDTFTTGALDSQGKGIELAAKYNEVAAAITRLDGSPLDKNPAKDKVYLSTDTDKYNSASFASIETLQDGSFRVDGYCVHHEYIESYTSATITPKTITSVFIEGGTTGYSGAKAIQKNSKSEVSKNQVLDGFEARGLVAEGIIATGVGNCRE